MRRHEKQGFTRGDIQAIINGNYRRGQIRRSPPNAKYPGTDWRGAPIYWSVSDRFLELNSAIWDTRFFRIRHGEQRLRYRLEEKLAIARRLDRIKTTDKPRLP